MEEVEEFKKWPQLIDSFEDLLDIFFFYSSRFYSKL
jgi:hypothetical protein